MEFISHYKAHEVDEDGHIDYSPEEHAVWSLLFERQFKQISGRACNEFLQGLMALNLNAYSIPSLYEIRALLQQTTGWSVQPVAALITAQDFFSLLAQRKFPVATFIRLREELDYVKEPDVFHELFGHCPMLVHPVFADFLQRYALNVLNHPQADWPLLQRLFWYTVEFGLIETAQGLRAYGGGILSSIEETTYAVESDVPLRVRFNAVAALRMPYRIDKLQSVYFVIQDFDELDAMVQQIFAHIRRARLLGEFKPLFLVDDNNPCIHINAC